MATLGRFFPPLWLLGGGAFGAVLLCLYIGAGVIETEQRRAELENMLEEYQQIVKDMPGMKQEFTDLQRQLTEIRSQKTATEFSLQGLRAQELEVRKLLAQRDSAVTQRDEAYKTLRMLQEQQSTLLKEKEQAKQEKLGLEKALVRLRGEQDGLMASTEKARNELAELKARTQAQQKLHELAQQEQKILEGFSTQVNATLSKFTSSVDALVETGRVLSAQGTKMSREVEGVVEMRTIMQKAHDEAVRSFADVTSTGVTAQKQVLENLRDQARGITSDTEDFTRQISIGRKAVLEMTTDMKSIQDSLTTTNKAMQDMAAVATALAQVRQTLDAATRDVMERSRQLERGLQTILQEGPGLRESRAKLDEARNSLDAAACELMGKVRQLEQVLQASMVNPGSERGPETKIDAATDNKAAVSMEPIPAQEQR